MFNVFVLENIIFLSTLILPEIAAALAPRLSLHDLTVTSILTAEKQTNVLERQIFQHSSNSPVLKYAYTLIMMKEVQRRTFIATFTIKSCYVTLVRVSKFKFKMYDICTESKIIFFCR